MKAGSFSWYDLTTREPASAASFYQAVFDWEANPVEGGDRPYTLFSIGGANVGGMASLAEDQIARGDKSMWLGYLLVDDVDTYAMRVKNAGGRICVAPYDIPGMLRLAVVADPHGAMFIVFKGYGSEGGVQLAADALGNVGWNELHAGDGAGDYDFYAGLFGWQKKQAFDMGVLGSYQTFSTDAGEANGGMMTKTPETPEPMWLFYFNVKSIDAAVARVTQAGGQITMGPHQVPTGQWIACCTDPQGAMFGMLSSVR